MRIHPLACLLSAALALAACGSGGATGDTSAPAATPSADTPAETPSTGSDAPSILSFEAASVSGATVDVESYAGKDLVVWFWAPW